MLTYIVACTQIVCRPKAGFQGTSDLILIATSWNLSCNNTHGLKCCPIGIRQHSCKQTWIGVMPMLLLTDQLWMDEPGQISRMASHLDCYLMLLSLKKKEKEPLRTLQNDVINTGIHSNSCHKPNQKPQVLSHSSFQGLPSALLLEKLSRFTPCIHTHATTTIPNTTMQLWSIKKITQLLSKKYWCICSRFENTAEVLNRLLAACTRILPETNLL